MQHHQASAKNRRLAAQMANRPGVQQALGGQPTQGTSIQNRLGNQNRLNQQNRLSVQGRLGGNKVAGMRSPNQGGRQQPKIAPGRLGQRRGMVAKRGAFAQGRGRGTQNRLGRGAGRGMQSGGRGTGRGMQSGGRGAGRGMRGAGRGGAGGRGMRGGRGRGGGASRGRGAQNNPTKSKNDLDKELDEYMTHTRGHLDAELDQYMQGAANDE